MQIECEIICLNIVFYWWKLWHFTRLHMRVLIHSHKWIISLQLRSRFPLQHLSFILCSWNNLNTANVCNIDRLSVLLWTFLFCFCCFKMSFSKLIHCKSDHCRPFQIFNLDLGFSESNNVFFFASAVSRCTSLNSYTVNPITVGLSKSLISILGSRNQTVKLSFHFSLNFSRLTSQMTDELKSQGSKLN